MHVRGGMTRKRSSSIEAAKSFVILIASRTLGARDDRAEWQSAEIAFVRSRRARRNEFALAQRVETAFRANYKPCMNLGNEFCAATREQGVRSI